MSLTDTKRRLFICFSRLDKKVTKMCFSKGGILWRFVIKICLIKGSTEIIQWQNFLQDPRNCEVTTEENGRVPVSVVRLASSAFAYVITFFFSCLAAFCEYFFRRGIDNLSMATILSKLFLSPSENSTALPGKNFIHLRANYFLIKKYTFQKAIGTEGKQTGSNKSCLSYEKWRLDL